QTNRYRLHRSVLSVGIIGIIGRSYRSVSSVGLIGRFLSSPDLLLQPLGHHLQHLHPRPILVIPLHQYPRRLLRAGLLEHIARRRFICVPLGAVAPILFRYLVLLVGRLLTRLE